MKTCSICKSTFANAASLYSHRYRFHSKSKNPMYVPNTSQHNNDSENNENQTSTSQEPVNIQHDKSFLNYEKILQELDMLKENNKYTEDSLKDLRKCFVREKRRLTEVVEYLNKTA